MSVVLPLPASGPPDVTRRGDGRRAARARRDCLKVFWPAFHSPGAIMLSLSMALRSRGKIRSFASRVVEQASILATDLIVLGALFVVAVAASAGAAILGERPCWARAHGIASTDCHGCHGGSGDSEVSLTPDRTTIAPGDTVTLTVAIKWASIRVGGAYITADAGTLQAVAGEGLTSIGEGLGHSAPKAAVNGVVTFRFAWHAPTTPGGVSIAVAALAANGNNAPSGDAPSSSSFAAAFGCAPMTIYQDYDGDGVGSHVEGATKVICANATVPKGFGATDGDCDENDAKVYPGAPEICNGKDDNCDGQIDEGAPSVALWPDGDGDGYYGAQTGTPRMGCAKLAGFAALGGDCNDNDPAIHPGAAETCNLKDDNCDGRVDERVRPQCGVGWCVRASTTCDVADCHPGTPSVEICNGLDDDCDGQTDEDSCGEGLVCTADGCVPASQAPSATGGVSGGPTGGSGAATGGRQGGATGGASSGATGGTASGASEGRGGCRLGADTSPASLPHALAATLLACALMRGRRRR